MSNQIMKEMTIYLTEKLLSHESHFFDDPIKARSYISTAWWAVQDNDNHVEVCLNAFVVWFVNAGRDVLNGKTNKLTDVGIRAWFEGYHACFKKALILEGKGT